MIAVVKPRKKMGRPRVSNSESTTINFTLPIEARDTLFKMAEQREISLAKVCREIILDWLKRIKEEK